MVPPSLPVSSLRAHLLSSLTSLPGSREFHLHVLATSPRKPGQSLFLYASSRPKCVVQDVLVLLSEITLGSGQVTGSENSVPQTSEGSSSSRSFVTAIEASVYVFPASDSTILYISKVDGTGQGTYPSPTSTLIRAFLLFYASFQSPLYTTPSTHHLWIHLFARSQRQYLFPNSADHPDKKPLGDVALCKWWKKILSDVAKSVQDICGIIDTKRSPPPTAAKFTRFFYLLPGQNEQEASYLLREAQPSSQSVEWKYSHPYDVHTETNIPFPCGFHGVDSSAGDAGIPLAAVIPHFEDDPKSRFLDELASTSEEQAVAVPVPTPKRKRQKIGNGVESDNSMLSPSALVDSMQPEFLGERKNIDSNKGDQIEGVGRPAQPHSPPIISYIPPSSSPSLHGKLSPHERPTTPEPDETLHTASLSPRTPNLPTYPISLLSPHTPLPGSSRAMASPTIPKTPNLLKTPQTPRNLRRPKSDLDTTSPAEFWERMSFRQECSQGALTGFFVGIFSQRYEQSSSVPDLHPHTTSRLSPASSALFSGSSATPDTHVTHFSEGTVPSSLVKRIMTSLLTGVEFSTVERTHKGTQVVESAIKGLCEGLGYSGDQRQHALGMTDPDIYHQHIYASCRISNPSLTRKSADSNNTTGATGQINVLGVRRKKKRET